MKRYTTIYLVIGLLTILGISLVLAAETKTAKEPTISDKRAMVKATKISMVDAINIATKKVPGTVIDSELENEGGKNIYSFELVPTTGNIINEINVDAASGTVISVEDANATDPDEKTSEKKETEKKESANDENQDRAEKQALAKTAKITMVEAIGIAAQKAKGTVIDGELETKDGKTSYIMEVLPDAKSTSTKRVTLDATSGTVLSSENLTAKKIAAEKAAEKKEESDKD